MTTHRSVVGLLALVLVMGAVGCGGDDDDAPTAEPGLTNRMTVREVDYGYELSGTPKAGTVTFAMENAGAELHMFGTCRLRDGKSVDDAKAAAESGDEAALGEVCVEGDPIDGAGGGQSPGSSYEVTVTGVQPGKYAAICFLPDKDGQPHFAKGMVAGFEVAEGEETTEPQTDVTFTAGMGIDGPAEVESGRTGIKVAVEGGTSREVTLVKIKFDKTPADVDAYFKTLDEGGFYDPAQAPVEFLSFAFDSAEARWFTVVLTEGQWAIGIEDPADDSDLPVDQNPFVKIFDVV